MRIYLGKIFMKIHYILALIILITSHSLFTMDWGQLFDRTHTQMQKEIVDILPAGSIALVSQEGESFPISIEAANQSETLKNMIGDIEANKMLPLSTIKSATLKEVVAVLNALKKNEELGDKKLSDKALLDSLEQTTAITDPFALLAAANYLDIPIVLHVAARRIAREEIKKNPNATTISEALQKRLKEIFGSNRDILPLMGRYNFLLNQGVTFETFNPLSFNLSIQDYIDYLPYKINLIKITEGATTHLTLNLANCFLHSLVGFENIPNINNVEHIQLQKNYIKNLPDFLFTLHKLERLDLSVNQISQISEKICDLTKLGSLNLSNNIITALPSCIGSMPSLTILNLESNAIKELPDLSDSQISLLNLAYNQLRKLPESLARMPRLHQLQLQNNHIIIDFNELSHFTRLTNLNISNNDFSLIEQGLENGTLKAVDIFTAIAKMRAIFYLVLKGIPLNDSDKDKLKRALSPMKVIL